MLSLPNKTLLASLLVIGLTWPATSRGAPTTQATKDAKAVKDAKVVKDAKAAKDAEVAKATKATPPANLERARGKGLAGLKTVVPKAKLPVVSSIRSRSTKAKTKGPAKIKLQIKTVPSGAKVLHGKKVLGVTPLTLEAAPMSTPLDLVLKRGGSMTLRTRVFRQVDHSYTFKLSPAKLH